MACLEALARLGHLHLLEQADGINDTWLSLEISGLLDKAAVPDQDTDDVCLFQGGLQGSQCDLATLKRFRQPMNIRLYYLQAAAKRGDVLGNTKCRAFTQVIDIRFKGNAQAGHSEIAPAGIWVGLVVMVKRFFYPF